MQQVLAIVAQILGLVLQLLPILQQIRAAIVGVAVEDGPKVIQSFVSDTYRGITDATYGLNALHTDIATVQSNVGTVLTNVAGVYAATQIIIDDIAALPAPFNYSAELAAILAAINALPTPPTPPSVSAIASGVWSTQIRVGHRADSALEAAGARADNLGARTAQQVSGASMFSVEGLWNQWPEGSFSVYTPMPNWAGILPSDTILSWLQRTDTNRTWISDPNTGLPMSRCGGPGTAGYEWIVRPTFTELPVAPFAVPPPVVIPSFTVAPVWPGVADATLGSTVSLVDQLELTGPMHGVILNVTTPPTKTGLRMIGGQPYDYNVGEIAFVSDRGDIEPWQYMGFRTAIFTPKTMEAASAALFRVLAGAVGTARTFTINE